MPALLSLPKAARSLPITAVFQARIGLTPLRRIRSAAPATATPESAFGSRPSGGSCSMPDEILRSERQPADSPDVVEVCVGDA